MTNFEAPISPEGEPVLIGEPVAREDGRILAVYQIGDNYRVEVDTAEYDFTSEEVLRIGNGDPQVGIMFLGRVLYETGSSNPNWPKIPGSR